MRILALIPARSGSKSVSHKNILPIAGIPMLAHSIRHAQQSATVTRIIVSTDSADYAKIAEEFGAECPFLRPAGISEDHSTDLEVFQHALDWLRVNEGYEPDLVVHLRPTHPVRNPADIDAMVNRLVARVDSDSIRSLSPAPHTPYKMWLKDDEDRLRPVASCGVPEAYNQPRQVLPEVFLQNASIDVIRTHTIVSKDSMTGEVILGYEMNHFFDIDTEDEFNKAKLLIEAASFHEVPRRFVIDIDGVIASIVSSGEYSEALPLIDNISAVNGLHAKGHQIVLFTARGYVTKRDWKQITEVQLQRWSVRYHELHFGKPNADIYVDDKFISISDLRSISAY